MKFQDTRDQENLEYLRTIMPTKVIIFLSKCDYPEATMVDGELEDYNTVRKCLSTMRKYAKNPWWLSNDQLTIAYYTLIEHTIITDFYQFKDSLGQLVGHKISDNYLTSYWYQLTAEVARIFYGNPMSKVEKKDLYCKAVSRYIRNLPLKQKKSYYLHPLSHADVLRLDAMYKDVMRQDTSTKAEDKKG